MRSSIVFSFISLIVYTEGCDPIKSCQKNSEKNRPICASDGYTYPNLCVFEKIRCSNKNLYLVERGRCKNAKKCNEKSEYFSSLVADFESPPVPKMKHLSSLPSCQLDGSFTPEQCRTTEDDLKICWCVTSDGAPLPNTISWIKKRKNNEGAENEEENEFKCDGGSRRKRRRKKKTLKRSAKNKNFGTRNPFGKNNKKNRVCKRIEKSVFNNNLIDSFRSEYDRYFARNDSDLVVITWKFRILDRNSDNQLEKKEYRDFKKIVKNAAKPKKCARFFPKNCDLNRDESIDFKEWEECLTRDGIDDGRKQSSEDDEDAEEEEVSESDVEVESEDEEEAEPVAKRPPPHGVLSSEITTIGNFDDESTENVEESTDCLSDRKTALSEGSQLYVPECTADGRYQKIQCYKSAGYCWCVNEDTGKNIPGTSVKNATPKCDRPRSPARPMRGCPHPKKTIFLLNLMEFFESEMAKSKQNVPDPGVVAWSFAHFDKNKNKVLEKGEWKAFKETVGEVRGLRRCGKRLPRYCDRDRDRRISLTEWTECLKLVPEEQQPQQQTDFRFPGETLTAFSVSPRAGKINPLSMLKDD